MSKSASLSTPPRTRSWKSPYEVPLRQGSCLPRRESRLATPPSPWQPPYLRKTRQCGAVIHSYPRQRALETRTLEASPQDGRARRKGHGLRIEVRRIGLFGSAARGDSHDASNLDSLTDLERKRRKRVPRSWDPRHFLAYGGRGGSNGQCFLDRGLSDTRDDHRSWAQSRRHSKGRSRVAHTLLFMYASPTIRV